MIIIKTLLILKNSFIYYFFFFLMIRRPPRSTLFPTRRSSDLLSTTPGAQATFTFSGTGISWIGARGTSESRLRSEEHTSELQSPCNLVCRLLLEKKKKKRSRTKNIAANTHNLTSKHKTQYTLC